MRRKTSPVWMVTAEFEGPPRDLGKVRADLAPGYQAQTAC